MFASNEMAKDDQTIIESIYESEKVNDFWKWNHFERITLRLSVCSTKEEENTCVINIFKCKKEYDAIFQSHKIKLYELNILLLF